MVQFSCGCTFKGVGEIPDNSTCRVSIGLGGKVHQDGEHYACDVCVQGVCEDYRPNKEPIPGYVWPGCVCGHAAEDHN